MDLIPAFVLNDTSYTIHTIWADDEPLFKANDIAKVLGIGNIHESLTSLTQDEKVLISTDTLGGPQQATCLKEAAAYRIVMRASLQKAIEGEYVLKGHLWRYTPSDTRPPETPTEDEFVGVL